MKKIFSLLTLFTFSFIGFFHNSMMTFALKNNYIEKNIWKSINCCNANNNIKGEWKCFDSCCIWLEIDYLILSANNNFEKKVFKIVKNYNVLAKNIWEKYFIKNKSLVKKTSPPYFERKIINYSYHTLIKIVKSNT